jgi:hypothetical protein
MIECTVAWAGPTEQFLWTVRLAPGATIADAIEAARALHEGRGTAAGGSVPWADAPTGVFGELRPRTAVVASGDRVELYRSLQADPKHERRRRARGVRPGSPR